VEDVIDGHTYWLAPSTRRVRVPSRTAFLLPLYDEYLIAYKDRRAALDPAFWRPIAARDPFSAAIVVDGRVVGGWKRTVTKGKVAVTVDLPVPLSRADSRLVAGAGRRFGAFLGLRPVMMTRTP
jgi:hypothetical protein